MSKKVVFEGRLLKIVTEKKRLPNGHISSLEIVQHPGAVLIVPFITKTKVILLKQYRPVIDKYIYELPAGTKEKNEKPSVCAKRETVEEIGYYPKRITKLGEIVPVPGYSTERITIYKAEDLIKKEKANQPDEIIESIIVTRVEVLNLFRQGLIIDAKTICAFAMCRWL